jgi:hypothetical protein
MIGGTSSSPPAAETSPIGPADKPMKTPSLISETSKGIRLLITNRKTQKTTAEVALAAKVAKTTG